jgi:hypothetical protein
LAGQSTLIVEVVALARPVHDFREMAGCSSRAAFHFAPTEKFYPPDSSALSN